MTIHVGMTVEVGGREAVIRDVRPKSADGLLSESATFAYVDTGEVSQLPAFMLKVVATNMGVGLSADEQAQLEAYEVVIANGLQTFYEVGTALADIRDSRLYRQQYRTFEDYCDQRWGMQRAHAYRLIEAAEVRENLSPMGDILPANERQTRPLTELEPEAQRLAWEVVKETAPQGKVTAAHVKSVVSVLKEVLTTGAIDNGEGESIPVEQATADHMKAAVTEETYERMKRQELHIVERQSRQLATEARREEKRQQAQNLPAQVFNVIYADPAWQYNNTGLNGAAEHHYGTMPVEDIYNLPRNINLCVADDAVLFLWATNPLLLEALECVRRWGFAYKTNLVWVKTELDKPGVGWYVRGRHELLLIATRGSFTPLDEHLSPPIGSVLEAPIQEHSRKPDAVYAIIERLYPGCNYVELFARRAREGWAAWGDEAHE